MEQHSDAILTCQLSLPCSPSKYILRSAVIVQDCEMGILLSRRFAQAHFLQKQPRHPHLLRLRRSARKSWPLQRYTLTPVFALSCAKLPIPILLRGSLEDLLSVGGAAGGGHWIRVGRPGCQHQREARAWFCKGGDLR